MACGVAFARLETCRAGIRCERPRGGNECSAGSVARPQGQGRSSASIVGPPSKRTPLTRTPAHGARLLAAANGVTARNGTPAWTTIATTAARGMTPDDHTPPAVARTVRMRTTRGARVDAATPGHPMAIGGQVALTATRSTTHAPPRACVPLPLEVAPARPGAAPRPQTTGDVRTTATTAPRVGAAISQARTATRATTGGMRVMSVQRVTAMGTVDVAGVRPHSPMTWEPTATSIRPRAGVTTVRTTERAAAHPANATLPRPRAGFGRVTTRIRSARPFLAPRWKIPGACPWPPAGPTRARGFPRLLGVVAALVVSNAAAIAVRPRRSLRASQSAGA